MGIKLKDLRKDNSRKKAFAILDKLVRRSDLVADEFWQLKMEFYGVKSRKEFTGDQWSQISFQLDQADKDPTKLETLLEEMFDYHISQNPLENIELGEEFLEMRLRDQIAKPETRMSRSLWDQWVKEAEENPQIAIACPDGYIFDDGSMYHATKEEKMDPIERWNLAQRKANGYAEPALPY